MSGLQFKIDQDFEYGVEITLDSRLNAGSLILLEPARDGLSGIPTQLVNYAADTAETITGSEIDTVDIQNNIGLIAGAFVERTAKGGIHGVFPQTVASMPSRANFSALLPDALKNYLSANKSHQFYIAVSGVVTRNIGDGSASMALAGLNTVDDVSGTLTQLTPAVFQSQASKSVAGGRYNVSGTLGRTLTSTPQTPWMIDVAQSSLTWTSEPSAGTIRDSLFLMGASSSTLANQQGRPCWVLYSMYVEDLTISGQTYAQAHAKSQAVYDSRFGTGGIYAGDTWTIPV